ncbi:RNA-directed DNA polymerase [Vibrio metschnikovii]|uniref:RNA-directed DNA polymerase n=1 Tax=Vibrio metschnikovii TaxID=28172 RepID=UPI00165D3E3D|nr:RNA-directed DNA polymerase [Vibrio metschnikovii]
MANTKKIKEFYLWDFEGTLFPMDTCRLLIEHKAEALDEYINKISDPTQSQYSFLSQETVYANKAQYHLRRTMKLDPVAEYYLYKMGFENRSVFRKSHSETRRNFGYRYENGSPISVHDGFKGFKYAAKELEEKYKYFIKFDIASYFNSIYHHDLTNWFSSLNVTKEQNELFGKFMREINTGFSIDFLPHGLYPSKMLGSHFLNFVDNSGLLQCEQIIRFMDDYILYSNSKEVLIKDFQVIQKILGQKSLNINSDKTVLFHESSSSITDEVSDIKSRIIEKVSISSGSGMDYEEYEEVVRQLSDAEVTYLINLLNNEEATDSEASLILDCIHEHSNDFEKYLSIFIYRFPHLAKKCFINVQM